ncbi:MAG: hypothetical protein NTW59_04705, partial [Candidatus Diapherotrites archaeon]|nr:hypothetical protein [Candidatus Diapherotrites archaeon]
SVVFYPSATSEAALSAAVEKAGYFVLKPKQEAGGLAPVDFEREAREKEINGLKKNFFFSLVLSVPLMLLMAASMLGLELPKIIVGNEAVLQLLLATPVIIIGRGFFSRGLRAIFNKSPTMDSLVAVGVGAAYAYKLKSRLRKLQWATL